MRLDITLLLIAVPLVLLSLTLHELGHAGVAALLGDQTARRLGRLTLNPLKHLDPLGAIMILISMQTGFGIGWAKPVPVDPRNLRYGTRVGMALVAAAGPIVNVLIALVALVGLQTSDAWVVPADQSQLQLLVTVASALRMLVLVNIGLAVFNMLPLAPLDGSKVLGGLLPEPMAAQYVRLEAWGPGLLLSLIVLEQFLHVPLLSTLLFPAMEGLLDVATSATEAPAQLLVQLVGWL